MALPASGAISLNEIHIEAGGTTATSATINDTDIRALISKGSGVTMSFSEWYGAASTAAVTLSASYSLTAIEFTGHYAGLEFRANGDIWRYIGTSGTQPTGNDLGDWVANKTGLTSTDYEWRVGNRTGTDPSRTGIAVSIPTSGFTAWQNFTGDFEYHLNEPSPGAFRSSSFTLEIRIDGGTAVSTTISLNLEV